MPISSTPPRAYRTPRSSTSRGIDYTWIGINVEKGDLADLKVRQAIRLGIDVDAIIQGAYSGAVSRAKSLLAPALLGYWADAPLYQRDVAKAQALLAETGKTGLTFTFTCLNDAHLAGRGADRPGQPGRGRASR